MAVILASKNIKSSFAISLQKQTKGFIGPEINGLSLTVSAVQKLGGLSCRSINYIRTVT